MSVSKTKGKPRSKQDSDVVQTNGDDESKTMDQLKDDNLQTIDYSELCKIKKDKIIIGDYSIDQNDLFFVCDAELDQKGLVNHHISSSNDLYTNGIPQIITQVFKVEKDILNQRDSTAEDKMIDSIHVKIKFTDVFINKPTTVNYYSGKEEILYPNVALLQDKTYSGILRVNADIEAKAYLKDGTVEIRRDEIKKFKLCRVPILVGTKYCNRYGCSKETLSQLNEDPNDPGGYFIVMGIEWVIDCVESILFNHIRIFKNEGYSKEIMHVDFVSKPGDTYQNSDYFQVRLFNDKQLTCEIARNQLKGIQIPFYILFRILGWTSDKEMFDNILYGYNDDISKNMMNHIVDFMNAKYTNISSGRHVYNQIYVIKLLINELKNTDFKYLDLDNKPENYQLAIDKLFNLIDNNFLPHIGLTAASRYNKLRFLALIIRKLLLVKMGNMEPTDRDSYRSKRLHAAGASYAKTFKTYFNASIIQQIKRRLLKDFRSMPFNQVDLVSSVKSSVYGADFERSIIQAITSGNKAQITVNRKSHTNRLSSQLLDRKNQISIHATLRQVSTLSTDSSKQSERANEMRRVHMSFMGYICIISTSDGERVGINKQLAISTSILGATSGDVIKDILLQDTDMIIPLHKTSYTSIYEENLRNVYVNGEWIGCTKDSLDLINKYRQMRRDFVIHPLTTIYWDNTQDEAFFWVDVGRVSRPLIIVYNNKRNPKQFPSNKYSENTFEQGIGITQNVIDGLKSKTFDIDYLLCNNLIEYITAEEQENCYLCPSFEQLKDHKNDELHEYTHCDIPQTMIGLTALTSPFAQHNQTPRITFQCRQATQTCGMFTLNWPYRCDKDTFLQYICETPLVKTVAYKYIYPNGCNSIVAIACYSGYNQEDSLVVSQGAVDRGLFDGSKFTFYKSELDQREEFGNPDIINTVDIKAGSYAKLNNGIINRGTKIKKGDAIIGKYVRISKTDTSDATMSDKSVIYKENEDAIVHNVIIGRNENDERFAKIGIRKRRPVVVGDKFCLSDDHEVLTKNGWINIKNLKLTDDLATLDSNHIIIYQKPTELPKFKHIGSMYKLENTHIDLITTFNHKMYVRENGSSYKSVEANDLFNSGKVLYYKKNAYNACPDIKYFDIQRSNISNNKLDMDLWIQFFGIYLEYGNISFNDINHISITLNEKIKSTIIYVLKSFGWDYVLDVNTLCIFNDDVFEYLKSHNGDIPSWCYDLSFKQSKLLLDIILLSAHYDNRDNSYQYQTDLLKVINFIQILAIRSGKSANIIKLNTVINLMYKINISSNIVDLEPSTDNSCESSIKYDGYVYCVTVPNHVFMVRRNLKYIWTCNSSRSGQKGVVGILLRDSDMPFTKDGIRPSIILNPHAIPSRMTIGQLYESQIGNWCAATGTYTDATIYRNIDIETIGSELEAIGMDRYGYHRLYSGISGEYIDTLIFMGPTYYQRLQKFVIDTWQCVTQGPTDALSRQPVSGRTIGGGLRIGEMERDVICSHGAAKFLQEKFFDHSDGFTEYICRCGKSAIVNVNKQIYKCKYCKDNADIAAIQTSWSSKLFIQEMESMNVGIRRNLKPFTYESVQDTIYE